MREVERQVMLRIIDQRWREHLEEMDYLKEGINLRAMGQKDPLTEWQREGFEMFGSMMKGIAQDFVRYVMHVQVVRQDQGAPLAATAPAAPSDPGCARRSGAGTGGAARPALGHQPGGDVGRHRPAVGLRRGRRGPGRPAVTGCPGPGSRRRQGRGPTGSGPRCAGPAQAGDDREGRVGQDAAQRTVPVRLGQEVQALPRRVIVARADESTVTS